jgi:hypothetical protein
VLQGEEELRRRCIAEGNSSIGAFNRWRERFQEPLIVPSSGHVQLRRLFLFCG